MRSLVTGAGGFVGSFLVRHLLERGDEVLGTRFADSDAENLECETVTLDITDLEKTTRVLNEYLPEVIYHLAGIAFVPEAENDFTRALKVNVTGTHNVFRVAHLLRRNIKILFISSAEVYGKIDPQSLPITEQAEVQPQNNYSLSKAMGELIVGRYVRQGQVRAAVLRPFNHIGPGQDNRFVASSFAFQLAKIAAGQADPVIRVGNLDARRDFSDVRDIVRAYRLCAEKGSGVYNLASGSAVPIQLILDLLIEISGLSVAVERDPARMRPAEVAEICGSYRRAEEELGWKPHYDIRASLEAVYHHWLNELQEGEKMRTVA